MASLLRAVSPDIAIEIVTIETTGDQIRDKPLSEIGGEGVFTKQIQRALLDFRADVAVHSLKDLPTAAAIGLTLAAVPVRGPTGDALLSHRHRSFAALPDGAAVATSSVRRKAQMLHRRPDLRLVDIRGNVETRVRKLAEQVFDALVLAEAGLQRLGLAHLSTEILDQEWMLPAVGQGALALECRQDDAATSTLLALVNDPPTSGAVHGERAMLRALGGGCQVPIAAASKVDGKTLTLKGAVLSFDGIQRIVDQVTGALDDPETLGEQLADKLLEQGAKALLQGGDSSTNR